MLFNTTIYKNVENGLIGTRWEHESDEKKALLIEAACKDAFADEFIARLPDVSLLQPHHKPFWKQPHANRIAPKRATKRWSASPASS